MRTAAKLGLLSTLYFSQGLPYGFFTQALPVLLRQQAVSLPAIGLSHLLALPWALKFLWAPAVDRLYWPRLGRRRSWIVPLQLLASLTLAALSQLPPQGGLAPLLAAVLVCNLLAATQDVATDGLAVDLLSEGERGPGNGVQVAGYRVGMIAGGGLLLVLHDRLGWQGSFLTMAGLLLLATLPVLWLREGRATAAPGVAVRAALLALLRRPGAWPWLGVLGLYKTGEALASGMLRAFLVDRGLGLREVGLMLGGVGFGMGLLGALLGGLLAGRLGRMRALRLLGVVQALSVLGYAAVAFRTTGLPALYAVCALEHLASGMATAALFTAMMDVCRLETGATDYTLQASAVVCATGLAAALSGYCAAALGYGAHFLVSTALCAAGAVAAAAGAGAWHALRCTAAGVE
ncbi:MAG: MFS transporter [Myxococcota bacterium]|nr:MFS transporter [Myxococcota bacterium]